MESDKGNLTKKFNKDIVLFITYIISVAILLIPLDTSIIWVSIVKVISMFMFFYLLLLVNVFYKIINFMNLWIVLTAAVELVSNIKAIEEARFSGLMVVFLLTSLIFNLMLVIRDLYVHDNEEYINSLPFKKVVNYIYRHKPLFIIIIIIIKVIFIIYAFSEIYTILYNIDPSVFKGEFILFDGLYLSFATYFTIGYGDVTPSHEITKMFTMIQMVMSYIMTVIVIPIIYMLLSKITSE